MEELKPCPFCGGEAKFGVNKSCCGKTVRIDCTNPQCGANINAYSSKAEAKKVWNRRATPENKVLTVDELRRMDGEPVWTVPLDGTGCGEWTIIDIGAQTEMLKALSPDTSYEECDYGKTWLAYARRPEGSEKS